MHVLRAEKGFIIVGQETDGTVDAPRSRHGLDRRQEEGGLHRQALARRAPTPGGADRKQLVGLLTEDPNEVLPEGAQIGARGQGQAADGDDRPRDVELFQRRRCGRSIAMALIKNGRNRMGETLYFPLEGQGREGEGHRAQVL